MIWTNIDFKRMAKSSQYPVVIVNDLLGGWMGERTFWNYMLDGFPEMIGLDHKAAGTGRELFEMTARKCIRGMSPDTVIIQNATYLNKISDENFTIAFLQDNLRAMNRRDDVQESVLKTSQMVVTNSQETARWYSEFKPVVIPIGIDTRLFHPLDKEVLREKYRVPPKAQVGIFVGDFTETKGWSDVKSLIDSHPNIFFIIVSKRKESYDTANTKCFNRVSQSTLTNLYNCADFFLLGSPVETQCLAALEAGFCGLPIVMKRTGVFMDFDASQRDSIGVFDNDLSLAFRAVLNNPKQFSPRETLLSLDLGIDSMISKWRALLESI